MYAVVRVYVWPRETRLILPPSSNTGVNLTLPSKDKRVLLKGFMDQTSADCKHNLQTLS